MQISCTDFNGVAHIVDAEELLNRLSVYGIYMSGGRVLLIKDPRSERWELPGGGVEEAETVRQGLTREFKEETGLQLEGKLDLLAEWEEYYFDVPGNEAWRSKRKFYLILGVSPGDPLLKNGNGDDSSEAKLVPIDEIETMNITQAIKEVILTARDRAKS